MSTGLEFVVAGLLLWILLSALLSPLESLGWWAGWFGESAYKWEGEADLADDPAAAVTDESAPGATDEAGRAYFVVFLTGIAGVAPEVLLPEEQLLVQKLRERLSDAAIVDDIFPYSVTNRALTGQRVFAWFWRYALQRKEKGGRLGFVINIRNLFQVLVSADRRYGPIYDRGTAQLILQGLRRHGYQFGSGKPVYLLGYSGGGQISVGAVPYLKQQLAAPIYVISLAGIISADPGLMEVEHLYHLRGHNDKVERLGRLICPGRWPLMQHSYWNQALQRGSISIIDMGPMTHNGLGAYLDVESTLPNGHSYLDETVDTLVQLMRQHKM